MLLGLPILGVALAGLPVTQYLEFPPKTRYVAHAPFSWAVFFAYALIILGVVTPLATAGLRALKRARPASPPAKRAFPWWGWFGLCLGLVSWGLAWTRFSWFAAFQVHTFTPLWISYILVINALTWRRTGRCMMTHQTMFFLALFPFSAAFWWFFEYLNRFVQNWYYTGTQFGPWKYFWCATLPFSTVLPAVLGTREWILSFPRFQAAFRDFISVPVSRFRLLGWPLLLLAGGSLAGIGVWPDYLFSLLWVSPLVIIVSLQMIRKEPHFFLDLETGDWRGFISAALAALMCGLFWETWNYYSLAKWEYNIPFVHKFLIFEMPALGYAGYLPFGLECAVIGAMIRAVVGRAEASG